MMKWFRTMTLATLGSLVIEFVLGIYTALFVEFPDTLVNGNAWVWSMKDSPIILTHIMVGTLLLVLSLLAVIFAFITRKTPAVVWSVMGLLLTVVAYLAGSIFLGNVEQDAYSFLMAIGFIGSMLSYGVAYYLTRPSAA